MSCKIVLAGDHRGTLSSLKDISGCLLTRLPDQQRIFSTLFLLLQLASRGFVRNTDTHKCKRLQREEERHEGTHRYCGFISLSIEGAGLRLLEWKLFLQNAGLYW